MNDAAKPTVELPGTGRRLGVDVMEDPDAGYVARVRGFDLYTQGRTERKPWKTRGRLPASSSSPAANAGSSPRSSLPSDRLPPPAENSDCGARGG